MMQMMGRAVSSACLLVLPASYSIVAGSSAIRFVLSAAHAYLSDTFADKEGVAIIMCETELEAKYQALVQGRTFLESCLHNNLAEHLNSEIGLGTIINIDSAKEWLHSSFLFRRIQQNPRHYAIGKEGNQTWQERIDNMVTESVERLRENQLVELSDDDSSILRSTEYGDIMSKVLFAQSLFYTADPRTSITSDNQRYVKCAFHRPI